MTDAKSLPLVGASNWQNCVFRASPRYKLFTDAASLASADEDSAVAGRSYGVLRARRRTALPDRVASPQLALVFLTLKSPARLPAHINDIVPGDVGAFIRKLVLDGILEVSIGGDFVSGPDALRFLKGEVDRSPAFGLLAAMSRRAILYAVTLNLPDQKQLALRVYAFGSQPFHGRRHQGHSPQHAWVISEAGMRATERWVTTAETTSWTMWRPRVPFLLTNRAVFKLYVSPTVDDVATVWTKTMTALPTTPGIVGVKLARGQQGLSRPDKIVAYFARLEDLQAAAALLSRSLGLDQAHGVPLSAEIVPSGLLSWGADRPAGPGRPSQSWRMWLSDRIAAHALAANVGTRQMRAGSVLAALEAEGVDTRRWAPQGEFWASMKE